MVTTKTYAAAFALRALHPKRVLFLVHREQIAQQALESFQRVIGDKPTYGLVGGGHKQLDCDYIFSTIQTFSKDTILNSFEKDAFDMIIMDEVHRAAADSYQNVLHYFHPKFWLGMSATPERTDGQNIYELFDFNVPLRISLRDALELNLLCPFHYYALSDLKIGDQTIEDLDQFNDLVSDERIRHILQQTRYYGYSGDRVKGLMFVSNIKEAKVLSEKLNRQGLRTLALDGSSSQEMREEAIQRLTQAENNEHALDYLITVDIFNEGVDIPEVNQVVLLRPTKSSIIFVQQLGRGLRKSKGKEYVVVLDFIGLYANNYMIPEALSESRDGNKDGLRRFVEEGAKYLPGPSTVYFDEVSRKRIFDAIDMAKINSFKQLKNGWLRLKDELGRTPKLVDFEIHKGLDPLLIFSNKNYKSYPKFLEKAVSGKEGKILPKYTKEEYDFLDFISTQWVDGKRLLEIWMLEAMKEDPDHWEKRFKAILKKHTIDLEEKTWKNLVHQMTRKWLTGTGKDTSSKAIFLERKNGELVVTDGFRKVCQSPRFIAAFEELVEFAKYRYAHRYKDKEKDGWLVLFEKYTYMDSFRNMDFSVAEIPTNVAGYKYISDIEYFPVDINYDKADDIVKSIAYEDHFISPSRLIAMSKNKRTLHSKDIERLRSYKEKPFTIPLFIRKNTKDELKEFYYLGTMHPTGNFEQKTMGDGQTTIVQIEYELDHPVREDLYTYLTQS